MTRDWAPMLRQLAAGAESTWPEYIGKLGLSAASLDGRDSANLFLIACCIDYQQPSGRAWEQARHLRTRLGRDVVGAVAAMSEDAWMGLHKELGLHRFPVAHARVHRIARRLESEHGADARRLWSGKDAPAVIKQLRRLGVGGQLSPMTAGGLADLDIIEGHGPVKADIHVRRVLGRVAKGHLVSVEEAIDLAESVYPGESWRLDQFLWEIGTNHCKSKGPRCNQCPLRQVCRFAQEAAA